MAYKNFNINDIVWVRLNSHGIKIWREQFEKYHDKHSDYTFEQLYAQYTTNGWTRVQLWECMERWGDHTSMSESCFETNILMAEKDLNTPKNQQLP